tara:strand:+ start:16304 stop:18715 length:2412 start_codon:yes stop_codon:yes gene_type:complete
VKNIFCLISFLIALPAFAQQDATLFGHVLNQQSGNPLERVIVEIGNEQSATLIAGTLTDTDGYFELEGIPTGNLTLTFTAAGFAESSTDIVVFAGNDNYNLGDIRLRENTGTVEEITVLGQQLDAATLESRIYSLDNNVAQSTGSLADVMRTLPGITVEQDGRIQLRGSDRVTILIDGRQSSLTGFGNQAGVDTIPAAGIESIEIINNPSSRFDATGMAGVINIRYKEEHVQGLNAEVGLSYGVGQLSKRKSDLPTDLGSFTSNPKITPRVNLSYNTEKRRYFFNAEVLKQEDLPNNEFTTRYYDSGRTTFSQVPENRKQIQTIVSGGMDWNIDDYNIFTLSAVLDYESHEDNAEVPFINGDDMQRYRFWFWREEEVTGFLNLNANYEHKFSEPGHELTGTIQYTRGWEDEDYYLNDRSALRNASDSTHLSAKENTVPIQIDYVRPLREGRIETGAKYQRRWIPIGYDVVKGEDTIIYPGLGDWSEWGENIYSAYGNLVYENSRYGVEGGVRVEQTDVYYDLPSENIYYANSDSYDYFEVYPSVRLSYKLGDNSSIAAYYNKRVDRPGEPELRIFPKYDDPELLKVGNPYLRPQFTTSMELAFEQLWNSGSLIFSVYQRDITDPFIRVFDIDNSNAEYDIVNRIYQNVGSATNNGTELIFSQELVEYWQLSGSLNWYENHVDHYETELLFPVVRPFTVEESTDDTWNFNLNNQFDLPYQIRMQLSYTYYAEKNFAQGVEAARSSIDLGLSKPILDNRGELVFSVTDLLNDFGIKQNIDGNGFNAVYENYYETQVISLGFTYRL